MTSNDTEKHVEREADTESVAPEESAEQATGASSLDEAAAENGAEDASAPKVVDKRRFARLLGFGFGTSAQEADEEDDPPRERLPAYVEELKERAERLQAQARAETDAARARLERHYEGRLASARADVIGAVLPVLDNLERALAVPGAEESALFEGVAATRDQFVKTLVELGAEPVGGEGSVFDPEVHEAVDTIPVDSADLDGLIVQVLQRGYRFEGRLVRPSIVRVGRFDGA